MSAPLPITSQLPEVLSQLKDVKSEATELRNFTITFLSLLLYVNLIIANTSAEQILRIAPVTLPLLNVPLPILGFYSFLPWLLLFFHLYLLLQHYLFSQQLYRFNRGLNAATMEVKIYVRKNLGNLPFLHWMIGKHHASMQLILTVITLVCLIVWPLVTMLWLQMAIMPYHSDTLIWSQRLAIFLDVILIAWLWPKILASNDKGWTWWRRGLWGLCLWLALLPRCLLWLMIRCFPTHYSRVIPILTALNTPFTNSPLMTLFMCIFLSLSSILACVLLLPAWKMLVLVLVLCWLELMYRYPQFRIRPTSPLRLWQTCEAFFAVTLSTMSLATGLFIILFLSLLVATLPDSWEEKLITRDVNSRSSMPTDSYWLRTVDVKIRQDQGFGNTMHNGETIRMAFFLTALLHEQHAQFFDVKMPVKKKEYDLWLNKSAKPCPITENTNQDNNETDSKPKPDVRCLMIMPILPRNLILREKVLTADAALKPEHEARLQADAVSKLSKKQNPSKVTDVDEQTKTKRNMTEMLTQIRGLNLQSRNFDYADFTGSSLPKVDFRYSSLKHVVFYQARLDQAHLDAVHLDYANLSEAKLFGAYLTKAELPDAQLVQVDFSDATTMGVNLSRANLDQANLENLDLTDAQLSHANLNNANLTGVILSAVTLTGAKLNQANLSHAHLNSADLSGADLTHAKLSADTVLTHANMKDINLSHVVLTGRNFSAGSSYECAHLTGATLYKTTLSGANLSYACMDGAILQEANLSGAILKKTDLSGADLTTANLSAANLRETKLHGANLSQASLYGAELYATELLGAELYKAGLYGADMSHAKLSGANLSFANLSGADMTYANLDGAVLKFVYDASLQDEHLLSVSERIIRIQDAKAQEDLLKKVINDYQQGLAFNLDYYVGKQHQQELDKAVTAFSKKIHQTPEFFKVDVLQPCISFDDRDLSKKVCIPEKTGDKKSRKALADNWLRCECTPENALNEHTQQPLITVWLNLACKDETKKHWVAQRMIERAKEFPWFAKSLLQVAKNTKTCPGLAGLTDFDKASLQEVEGAAK